MLGRAGNGLNGYLIVGVMPGIRVQNGTADVARGGHPLHEVRARPFVIRHAAERWKNPSVPVTWSSALSAFDRG